MDDLRGRTVRQVRRAAARGLEDDGRTTTHEALGEDLPRWIGDLDRVLCVEAAPHVAHAGGQERSAPLGEGTTGAVVDDHRAGSTDRERDPELARRKAPLVLAHDGADARITGGRIGEHARTVGRGDDRSHARPRRDLHRRQLRGHAATPPRRSPPTGKTLELVWTDGGPRCDGPSTEPREGPA